MREIELCPGCYGLTVKQPKDWFCIPCVSDITVLYNSSRHWCVCTFVCEIRIIIFTCAESTSSSCAC